jgi:hypothetical protein
MFVEVWLLMISHWKDQNRVQKQVQSSRLSVLPAESALARQRKMRALSGTPLEPTIVESSKIQSKKEL